MQLLFLYLIELLFMAEEAVVGHYASENSSDVQQQVQAVALLVLVLPLEVLAVVGFSKAGVAVLLVADTYSVVANMIVLIAGKDHQSTLFLAAMGVFVGANVLAGIFIWIYWFQTEDQPHFVYKRSEIFIMIQNIILALGFGVISFFPALNAEQVIMGYAFLVYIALQKAWVMRAMITKTNHMGPWSVASLFNYPMVVVLLILASRTDSLVVYIIAGAGGVVVFAHICYVRPYINKARDKSCRAMMTMLCCVLIGIPWCVFDEEKGVDDEMEISPMHAPKCFCMTTDEEPPNETPDCYIGMDALQQVEAL